MDVGSIAFLLVLIGIHAIIALAYAAVTNSRETHFKEQETGHGEDIPPRLHLTYQLSLLLIRFTIAAVAVTALGQEIAAQMMMDNRDLARVLAYIVVLFPTAIVTLILGDLVPEAIGSTRADALAPTSLKLLRVLTLILSPLVTAMIALSRWLAGIFGSGDKVNVFTEEEILTMLDASEKEGAIENEEKEMIYSVLQFGDRLAREVMVPRIDIVAVEISTPLEKALSTFMETGHSRIPVYEDNIDNIKGLLYAKDLLRERASAPRPLKDCLRKAFFVPESKQADVLLRELRANKIHMAIVVDEYGGTAGLVTIEDLIEEIIGDIQDEYDLNEEAEYVQQGPDTYMVDASINLSDFNDLLDVEFSNEDSDTLGGFMFTLFGRVPEVGESVEHGNLNLRIEKLDGRRIRKVQVTRITPPPQDAPDTSADDKPASHPLPLTE